MKRSISVKAFLGTVLLLPVVLTGCSSIGLAREESFESNYEIDDEAENIYVSAADAMVRYVDPEMQIIDFYVLGSSDVKTLIFDGTTTITDAYGQPMVASQLQPGDLVHVLYNSTISKVGDIHMDENTWSNSGISRYTVSENGQSLQIGDDMYSIDPNLHVFSRGEEIGLNEIIDQDVITVLGRDRNILGIRVDSGHGYLELKNEYALIGGWIEVGQAVISEVMDDMLFTVPEGSYRVRLTNTGIEEYRDVTIERNMVCELDLSDIVAVEPDKGVVFFDITPEGTETYVDGSYVDTRYAIRLPVGLHEISVSAAGYSSVTEYFEVTGADQTLRIHLDDDTYSGLSSSSVSENSISRSLYTVVHVNTPQGAEVYEDNIYKGMAPVNYQKTPGTHVITLRRNGYKTVSYSVIMEDNGKDEAFDFPEMEREETSSTVSGNDVSNSGTGDNTVSGNTSSDRINTTVSGNTLVPGTEFFPKASTDLLWDDDLKNLSEEGLFAVLNQLESGKYENTAFLRENKIRVKKALEKYGYTEEYWNSH